MSDLRFGHDIQQEMQEWWEQDHCPNTLAPTYGNTPLFVLVYGPDQSPLKVMEVSDAVPLLTLAYNYDLSGPGSPDDLRNNVAGKLNFVWRTFQDSAVAERRPDLVEPGDFPYGGAGEYRSYVGGASGLPGGDKDWKVVTDVIDKLILVRGAAAEAALSALHNSEHKRPGIDPVDAARIKYLGRSPLPQPARLWVPQAN